jgi:hypothetical protein
MRRWQHQDAATPWGQLSLAEQLGHVGSEVGRAVRWAGQDAARSQAACFRALDLIDLTLDDERHRCQPARLRELARAREVMVDFLAGSNEHRSTAESLERYFTQFAVAARLARPS